MRSELENISVQRGTGVDLHRLEFAVFLMTCTWTEIS